ncbi:prephenate dehydrogenase [Streptomyces sp. NPDC051555]|uniref:prephenate dehydrogenase n=1 Tax=Streptomyces sp. NPDC051555 TaxID=3365657 RepID=UPI0037962870
MRSAAVVGTGMMGTSVALSLARRGVAVHLIDENESAARTAASLGAGVVGRPGGPVDLAVLAVPPTQVGAVLAAQQAQGLARAYTDVASVKTGPELSVSAHGGDAGTFIGGHPMAGRERSGPLAACATLFEGRTWVLTPTGATSRDTLNTGLMLISMCGAVPVVMDSRAHDLAVARVSHTPHVLSSLLAARLEHLQGDAARLAGQGLRDMTRIAGGDPRLWSDILESNATAVADVLTELSEDLAVAVAALRGLTADDADERAQGTTLLADLLGRGRTGRERIPVKYGHSVPSCKAVRILIGDQPGELSRLLQNVAELDVNVEDMTIDHSPGEQSGLVELLVPRSSVPTMDARLRGAGWRVQSLVPEGTARRQASVPDPDTFLSVPPMRSEKREP